MNKKIIAITLCALTSTTLYATLPIAPPPSINCQYHIPTTTNAVKLELVSTWAKKAAVQSFDLNHNQLDKQLATLKMCYTDQGWKGFYDALQKSGNIAAIKAQKLTATSQINGIPHAQAIKSDQWKVTLPLRVVYQNDKERFTQALNVDLIIGRKESGDLGIMQLIAAPKKAT